MRVNRSCSIRVRCDSSYCRHRPWVPYSAFATGGDSNRRYCYSRNLSAVWRRIRFAFVSSPLRPPSFRRRKACEAERKLKHSFSFSELYLHFVKMSTFMIEKSNFKYLVSEQIRNYANAQ